MANFGDMIKKGEKALKKTLIDLDARTIEVYATTKRSATDPSSLYHRWVFDLSEASDEVIWTTAARGFVIDMQRTYRDDEENDNEYWSDRTLIFPDDFTSERKAAKPSKKTAKKYLDTLTKEQRLALLEEIEAEEADGEDDDAEA